MDDGLTVEDLRTLTTHVRDVISQRDKLLAEVRHWRELLLELESLRELIRDTPAPFTANSNGHYVRATAPATPADVAPVQATVAREQDTAASHIVEDLSAHVAAASGKTLPPAVVITPDADTRGRDPEQPADDRDDPSAPHDPGEPSDDVVIAFNESAPGRDRGEQDTVFLKNPLVFSNDVDASDHADDNHGDAPELECETPADGAELVTHPPAVMVDDVVKLCTGVMAPDDTAGDRVQAGSRDVTRQNSHIDRAKPYTMSWLESPT